MIKDKILPGTKGDFIMTKGSVYQEDIIILNVYAPNNRSLKYMILEIDRTAVTRQIHNFRYRF